MRGLLKITGIGYLGSAPSISYMPSGDKVANFKVAVTEQCKDSNSELTERTEWLKCHAIGDLADVIESRCKKGTQVYIEAGFKPTRWVGNDKVRNKGFELRIKHVLVLGNSSTK